MCDKFVICTIALNWRETMNLSVIFLSKDKDIHCNSVQLFMKVWKWWKLNVYWPIEQHA